MLKINELFIATTNIFATIQTTNIKRARALAKQKVDTEGRHTTRQRNNLVYFTFYSTRDKKYFSMTEY